MPNGQNNNHANGWQTQHGRKEAQHTGRNVGLINRPSSEASAEVNRVKCLIWRVREKNHYTTHIYPVFGVITLTTLTGSLYLSIMCVVWVSFSLIVFVPTFIGIWSIHPIRRRILYTFNAHTYTHHYHTIRLRAQIKSTTMCKTTPTHKLHRHRPSHEAVHRPESQQTTEIVETNVCESEDSVYTIQGKKMQFTRRMSFNWLFIVSAATIFACSAPNCINYGVRATESISTF